MAFVLAVGVVLVMLALWRYLGRDHSSTPRKKSQHRPLAPDDDPDFLRNLETKKRPEDTT